VVGDLNYDGHIEGVEDEIEKLLEALAMYLPPQGQPTYEYDENHEFTDKEKKALYNYLSVEDDGSHGIHNPGYASAILRASVNDMADPFNSILKGINIPVGGDWFYSPWFEFYAPSTTTGWIYHFEHGYLYVTGDANNVYLYEHRTGQWRYTNPTLYPVMYEVGTATWLYYAGRYDGLRYFYNYNSGQWNSIN
jgi:hypothetical protein